MVNHNYRRTPTDSDTPSSPPSCTHDNPNPFLAMGTGGPPRRPGQPPSADLENVLGSIDFDVGEAPARPAGGLRRVK